jgi:hypothetical protein
MTRSHDNDNIGPTTPLRLARAAALAFPDGSMTEKGLRREFQRGRLVVERIAGKDYTTLSAIEQMRILCRLEKNHHDSGYDQRAASVAQRGSSFTNEGSIALAALKSTLRARKKS